MMDAREEGVFVLSDVFADCNFRVSYKPEWNMPAMHSNFVFPYLLSPCTLERS